METCLPFRVGRVQGLAGGLLGGSGEAVPAAARDGRGVRALLLFAAGTDSYRRTSVWMGFARTAQPSNSDGAGFEEKSSRRRRFPVRDESVAGELAASRNSHRAADDH